MNPGPDYSNLFMMPFERGTRFTITNVYASDSRVPEEDLHSGGKKKVVKICKVCKQPLGNSNYVICSKCGHYAHTEHSQRYKMSPYCHTCIIEDTGVDKRSYKFFAGVYLEFKEWVIKKVAHFNDRELAYVKNNLLRNGLIEEHEFLIFKKLEATHTGREIYPVLENVYKNEGDVNTFLQDLLLHRTIPIISRFLHWP